MKHRPWYLRKRILLPLLLLALLIVAVAAAVARSDVSRIIVFNETGETLSGLRLSACGQATSFRNLPAESSIRWKLEPLGSASEIGVELAAEPPVRWLGGYIEPHGGYVITLRLWPDGQVEAHTQISFWQRAVKGAPNVNE